MVRRNMRGVSNGMIPLMLLQAAETYRRLDRKPPVTAALLAANTIIYLRPAFLNHIIPPIDDVWFNAYLILKHKDVKRLLLSAFYHLNEPHLFYNMTSLLWKGVQLENAMGSVEYASMVAVLVGLSQGITLLLAKSLLVFDYERAYYNEYAVGFSGVLFAMKVVLNSQSDSYTSVHGIMVPAKHAAWAELIIIQLLVPGVSFLGHLGGILAGIVYVQLKGSSSGPSPLANMVKGLTAVLGWPLRSLLSFWRPHQPRVSGRGRIGGGELSTRDVWRCRACTFDNSGWLTECEMCGTEHGDDGLSSSQGSSVDDASLDEIRQRRIQRFGR
ncbi:rhomboid-like protein 14, mitochondrial [Bidens hawaiensis]|uniref:rhomboid-like protein 14, mitochondrial n=1 Tax=Bidens hawaiensis TaxID=980011 RepID=UPI00404AC0FE